MPLAGKFTEHPASVGETYGQHFVSAMGFSLSMIKGSLCCALHAFLPFMCEKHGSEAITRLYERMVTNRGRLAANDEVASRIAETRA